MSLMSYIIYNIYFVTASCVYYTPFKDRRPSHFYLKHKFAKIYTCHAKRNSNQKKKRGK